jgi:hypothetical protein
MGLHSISTTGTLLLSDSGFFFSLCWLLILFVLSRHGTAELADSPPQSPTDITQAAGAKDDEDNDQDNYQFGQTYSLQSKHVSLP